MSHLAKWRIFCVFRNASMHLSSGTSNVDSILAESPSSLAERLGLPWFSVNWPVQTWSQRHFLKGLVVRHPFQLYSGNTSGSFRLCSTSLNAGAQFRIKFSLQNILFCTVQMKLLKDKPPTAGAAGPSSLSSETSQETEPIPICGLNRSSPTCCCQSHRSVSTCQLFTP